MSTTARSPDFRTETLSFGAHRMSLRRAGEGPPLVLCHSLLADESSFDRVAGALAETHEVAVLALPGFGASTPAPGGLEAVADRVAEGLGHMGWGVAPTLLGNGYGGFVSLLTAIRHPGLAGRLILTDCGACFPESGRAAFRAMSAAVAQKGLESVADTAMRRLFSADYQAANPHLVAERRQRFLALDPATFHQACDALAGLDLRDRLPSVRLPALVLVGEEDEATPPAMARELAAGLPQARLLVLPGCAHVPQLQAPDQFLAAVRPFLAEQRR